MRFIRLKGLRQDGHVLSEVPSLMEQATQRILWLHGTMRVFTPQTLSSVVAESSVSGGGTAGFSFLTV